MGHVKLHNFVEVADGPNQFVFCLQHDQGVEDDLSRFSYEINQIPDETEREQVVRSRVGQGRFRESLIRYWNGECAISGVNHPAILTASHIRPWRSSSNAQRLDTFNGLLLLAQYDRLFDFGLISFDDSGQIMVSKAFPRDLWQRSGIGGEARITKLDERHKEHLDYHRICRFVRVTED